MGGIEHSHEPWVGRRLPRADARRLVAGRGRYVDDMPARGELHAAFLRSPYPHAAFRVADSEQAARAPGVAAVLVAADLAPVCRDWVCPSLAFPGLVSPAQRALADGRAAYQGEPVAMVLAASRAQAEDAVERLVVEWQELPAITDLHARWSPMRRAPIRISPPTSPGEPNWAPMCRLSSPVPRWWWKASWTSPASPA